MAGKGKAHQETPAHEVFKPVCKWQREEDKDIIEIHLQDFKREQLSVKIFKHGILEISGERELDTSAKKLKFHKEIPVPINTYNIQDIQAHFIEDNLYITIPKINPKTNGKISSISSEPSKIDQTTVEPPTTQDNISGGAEEQTPHPGGNAPPEFEFLGRNPPTLGPSLAVSLAAMTAAVAVLIAHVVYMYKSHTWW